MSFTDKFTVRVSAEQSRYLCQRLSDLEESNVPASYSDVIRAAIECHKFFINLRAAGNTFFMEDADGRQTEINWK
jgi:hypothetical protein